MKLIIVRHGETEENKKGILQGHLPGKLTKLGLQQARKLAQRLSKEDIGIIYSSDLARASDTTMEIAKSNPGAKLFFVQELREKNQGSLTGKIIKEIDWSKPRATEKSDSMIKRGKRILKRAHNQGNEKTILFVSHGGMIRVLLSILLNKSLEDIKKMDHPKNASLSIFSINKGNNFKVIFINCTKHLD